MFKKTIHVYLDGDGVDEVAIVADDDLKDVPADAKAARYILDKVGAVSHPASYFEAKK